MYDFIPKVTGSVKELLVEETFDISSGTIISRKQENDLADAQFTMTARKAAEVNEGGLIDPTVP